MDEVKRTLEYAKKISQYLYGYEPLSIPIVVNPLTICLKQDKPPNSILLITPKGTGKSTILRNLAESNPDYFVVLPDRVFETTLLNELQEDDFKRKIWIIDDLVVTFQGLNSKQRSQLQGAFLKLLTEGEYVRTFHNSEKKEIRDARISCMFGIAKENYSKYSKEMYYSTLMDRLTPLSYDFLDEKEEIAYRVVEHNISGNCEFPYIKLPLREEDVTVDISSDFMGKITQLSKQLSAQTRKSIQRSVQYVTNFIRANALMNDREYVVEADINLFSSVLGLHSDISKSDTIYYKVVRYLIQSGCEVSSKEIKEALGIPDKTWEKVLPKLKQYIFYQKRGNTYYFYI